MLFFSFSSFILGPVQMMFGDEIASGDLCLPLYLHVFVFVFLYLHLYLCIFTFVFVYLYSKVFVN